MKMRLPLLTLATCWALSGCLVPNFIPGKKSDRRNFDYWELTGSAIVPAVTLGSSEALTFRLRIDATGEATAAKNFTGYVTFDLPACLAGSTAGNPVRLRVQELPDPPHVGLALDDRLPSCPEVASIGASFEVFGHCSAGVFCDASRDLVLERRGPPGPPIETEPFEVSLRAWGYRATEPPPGAAVTLESEP